MSCISKLFGGVGCRSWCAKVLTLAWLFPVGAYSADPSICGAPSYDSATDTGLYLWAQNCGGATPTISLRALAGGSLSTIVYDGWVDATQSVGGLTEVSLEPNDLLELLQGDLRVYYQFSVTSPWFDGFSFDAADTGVVCFGANLPPGTQVRLGPDATPVNVPIDLNTLQPCASIEPVVCGTPAFDSATDSGLYLWAENCGRGTPSFSVRAMAGGSPGTLMYSGQVEADQAIAGVTGISLEANDLLDVLAGSQQVDYLLNVTSPWYDGFSFDAQSATDLCFTADLPPGTQVRVGPDATAVGVPFNLRTLEPCSINPPDAPLNIVVILSDDQRWDTLWAMPSVDALAAQGVSFPEAFVSYPVCGPIRASLLSGGYRASNTGIISNNQAIAPIQDFNDSDTLPLRLQQAGYQTLFVGKYINGYPGMGGYVPPGWTRWIANNQGVTQPWYDFTVVVGSSGDQPSTGSQIGPIAQHVTEFHRDEVLSFLDGVGDQPFFVFWSAFAPHSPATPLLKDEDLFPDYEYRDRAWGETDLSDKPNWVWNPDRNPESKQPDDEFHRDQLRSLQALDRGVEEIVQKVADIGKADNTVFFFLSDNGYQWGEHGLSGKGVVYEESLRVPLVVWGPGIQPGTKDELVLADLDLAPTIIEMAGLPVGGTDGMSLAPLIAGENPVWRESMLFESWGNFASGPYGTWAALQSDGWKYTRQANGEEELYDLLTDPFEEESLHLDPTFDAVRMDLSAQLDAQKSLAVIALWPPIGTVGVPYSLQLNGWGGSGSYSWFVHSGQLPPGLALNGGSGLISGTPSASGTSVVVIRVEDGTIAAHSGNPRRALYRLQLSIQ